MAVTLTEEPGMVITAAQITAMVPDLGMATTTRIRIKTMVGAMEISPQLARTALI
jgi:hypothetical protein